MINKLLLVAVGIAVIVALLRPRSLFTIRFAASEARLRRGKAPRRFVQEVQDVLSEAGVSDAKITAIGMAGRVSLRFSKGVPENCRQRLRNAWAL